MKRWIIVGGASVILVAVILLLSVYTTLLSPCVVTKITVGGGTPSRFLRIYSNQLVELGEFSEYRRKEGKAYIGDFHDVKTVRISPETYDKVIECIDDIKALDYDSIDNYIGSFLGPVTIIQIDDKEYYATPALHTKEVDALVFECVRIEQEHW